MGCWCKGFLGHTWHKVAPPPPPACPTPTRKGFYKGQLDTQLLR